MSSLADYKREMCESKGRPWQPFLAGVDDGTGFFGEANCAHGQRFSEDAKSTWAALRSLTFVLCDVAHHQRMLQFAILPASIGTKARSTHLCVGSPVLSGPGPRNHKLQARANIGKPLLIEARIT